MQRKGSRIAQKSRTEKLPANTRFLSHQHISLTFSKKAQNHPQNSVKIPEIAAQNRRFSVKFRGRKAKLGRTKFKLRPR